jgi:hypothetical protein
VTAAALDVVAVTTDDDDAASIVLQVKVGKSDTLRPLVLTDRMTAQFLQVLSRQVLRRAAHRELGGTP